MMTSLWIHEGQLRADGRSLVLDTTGPSFTAPGEMAPYQDRIEIVSPDRRIMTSHAPGAEGTWQQFMSMTFTRRHAAD
jgi:hypothetical protein